MEGRSTQSDPLPGRSRAALVGYSAMIIVGGILMGRRFGYAPSAEVGAGAGLFLAIGGLALVSCLVDRRTLVPVGIALAGGVAGAYAAYWGLDEPAPTVYSFALTSAASLFMAADAIRMLFRVRRADTAQT